MRQHLFPAAAGSCLSAPINAALCLSLSLLVMAALLGPANAGGLKESRGTAAAEEFPFWGDQKGCYWHRGERHCSQYCYWEVNGRRYCHPRERRAHPQGVPGYRPYPPEPPIYARPPHYRP